MKHVKHPQQNTMAHPPAGWDDRGGVLRLPVIYAMQGKVPGTNVKVFLSRWKPTAAELAMLLEGGEVELTCVGGQPACNLAAVPPNELQAPHILLPH